MGTRSRVDTSPVAQGCPRGLKLRVQYENHTFSKGQMALDLQAILNLAASQQYAADIQVQTPLRSFTESARCGGCRTCWAEIGCFRPAAFADI
jgi:hypothetical protein